MTGGLRRLLRSAARGSVRAAAPPVLLRLALLSAFFAVALVLPEPFRAIVAAPFVLVLPGLALELLLLPNLPRRDPVVAAAVAVILSLAVVALVVILLYGLTGDVRELPYLLPLLLSAAWIVAARLQPRRSTARRLLGGRKRSLLGVVLSVCATAGAATATTVILQKPLKQPSSAISFDGRWARIDSLPLVGAAPVTVQVRVYNDSTSTQHYRVRPEMAGAVWKPVDITVPKGRSWRGEVSGVVPSGGCAHRLLIRLEGPTATGIRGLTAWFTRSPGAQKTCLDTDR